MTLLIEDLDAASVNGAVPHLTKLLSRVQLPTFTGLRPSAEALAEVRNVLAGHGGAPGGADIHRARQQGWGSNGDGAGGEGRDSSDGEMSDGDDGHDGYGGEGGADRDSTRRRRRRTRRFRLEDSPVVHELVGARKFAGGWD